MREYRFCIYTTVINVAVVLDTVLCTCDSSYTAHTGVSNTWTFITVESYSPPADCELHLPASTLGKPLLPCIVKLPLNAVHAMLGGNHPNGLTDYPRTVVVDIKYRILWETYIQRGSGPDPGKTISWIRTKLYLRCRLTIIAHLQSQVLKAS